MRKSSHFITVEEKPNYPDEAYCNGCKKRWPLEKIVCDICNRRVRRNPVNKNKNKWKFKRH
jgi:rRNA maturation endonuclease Nob1